MPDPTEAVIHIHEDIWGMRNLLPLEERAQVSADMDEAVAAAERNRAPGGVGWTAMHLIEPPRTTYVEVGLRVADAAAALAAFGPRVRRFTATIGSAIGGERRDSAHTTRRPGASGSAPAAPSSLTSRAISSGRSGSSGASAADGLALRRALESLDRLVPSFIADYFLRAEGEVSDAGFLGEYFERLAASRAD